jgi:hypothetical protein
MAVGDPILKPFWELTPQRQEELLRKNLIAVLTWVTDGEIGPDDFAQEVALHLSQHSDALLFRSDRRPKGRDKRIFHAVQKETFLTLIAPYRWQKRNERVVPYSDTRWVPDEERPNQRTLIRRPWERSTMTSDRPSRNREEALVVALLDAYRQLKGYPEVVIEAALGAVTRSHAAKALRMRKARALRLIEEARCRIAAPEFPE